MGLGCPGGVAITLPAASSSVRCWCCGAVPQRLSNFFLTSATLSSELSLTSAFMSVSDECVTNTVTLILTAVDWRALELGRRMHESKMSGFARTLCSTSSWVVAVVQFYYKLPKRQRLQERKKLVTASS